ncbi:MAG: hypothetical protein ABJ327_20850 [Litoreibacter sp.]
MRTNREVAIEFIKNCIFPDSFFAKLSVLLASISMVSLLSYAVEYGISDMFSVLLNWYETFLGLVFGWLGSILDSFLRLISRLLQVNFTLQPHWHHVFVLMNVYFLRDALFYRTTKHLNINRSNWHFGLGLTLAVFVSCASGVIIDDGSSVVSSALVAVFSISAIIIYDLIERSGFVWHLTKIEEFSQHGISNNRALSFYRSTQFGSSHLLWSGRF